MCKFSDGLGEWAWWLLGVEGSRVEAGEGVGGRTHTRKWREREREGFGMENEMW